MKMIKKLFPALMPACLLWSCASDAPEEPYDPHRRAEYVADEEEMYQAIYDRLTDGSFNGELRLYGYATNDRAFEISGMVIYDHPELFWADISSVGSSPQHNVISINYGCRDYKMTESETEKMCEKVSEEADRIINSIPADASDWEKALFVHDEIVRNTWYQSGDEDFLTDTVYSCLVRHRTQSMGYAQAFQYIMERMGFECGMFSNGGSTWNFIRLDGRYYWVDLAGDDPVYEDDIPYNYTHNFFMCDDEHFADTHDLSMGKNRFVPKCSDLSRYYYVADGSYMSGFDADAMAGIIMKHYDEEQAEVKFETEAAYKEALKGLGKAETSLAFVNAGIDLSRISYCGTEGFIVKTIITHDGEK